MSSSGGNRKSMDDVLASIRRIIGAEKKDGYDDMPESGDSAAAQDPLTLGAPIRRGDPEKLRAEVADPLSLTPNMRVDFSKLTQEEGTRIAPPAGVPMPPPPAREPAPRFEPEEADDDAVVIDEAALEDMIRRIVREELDARAAEADDSEDAMRRIVREELGGETGQAISRNVLRLIQSEVAKLLAARG